MIDKAITAAGGVTALAKRIEVAPNVVSNWRMRGVVPPEHCRAIEDATHGAVTRYELRPDVFGSRP